MRRSSTLPHLGRGYFWRVRPSLVEPATVDVEIRRRVPWWERVWASFAHGVSLDRSTSVILATAPDKRADIDAAARDLVHAWLVRRVRAGVRRQRHGDFRGKR